MGIQRYNTANLPRYISQRYYLAQGPQTASVGAAPGANSIRLYPGYIPQKTTIDRLLVRVNTGNAGNIQAAIYAADPSTYLPIGPALTSTASMDTSAAASVNAAASCIMQPGVYWFATNCDNGSAVMAAIGAGSNYYAQVIGLTTSTMGGSGAMSQGYSFAQTFGTWPDLTGQSLVGVVASTIPMVEFKVL